MSGHYLICSSGVPNLQSHKPSAENLLHPEPLLGVPSCLGITFEVLILRSSSPPNPTRGQIPKVILTVCKIITTKKLGLMLGRGQNQSSLHPCRMLEHGSFSLSYLYPQHQALPSTCALSMLCSELLRVSTLNKPQLWGTRKTAQTPGMCVRILWEHLCRTTPALIGQEKHPKGVSSVNKCLH